MVDVSVVIPFHNDWKVCIELIKKQYNYLVNNHYSFEFIIVDDCSNEVNSTILQNQLKSFNHINYNRLVKNLGQFGAIAFGLSKSDGKIIVITDQDINFIEPNDLNQMLSKTDQFDLQYAYVEESNNNLFRNLFSKIWHLLIVLNTQKRQQLENPLPFRVVKKELINHIIDKNYIVTALDIALLKYANKLSFHKIEISAPSINKKSQYSALLLIKIGLYFIISILVPKPLFSLLLSLIITAFTYYLTKSIFFTSLAFVCLVIIHSLSYLINKKQSYQQQIKL